MERLNIENFLIELNGRGFSFNDMSHTEFGFNDEILNMVYEMYCAGQQAQAVPEGYVLVSRKMPDEINDHLWDFMTDNFVCVNEYGDSFMACDDFDLEKLYVELVKAQEST